MEDDEFLREVLRLAEGHTVEEFDNDIRCQAQQLGIPVPRSTPVPNSEPLSRPASTSTCVSHSRRSVSIASQASYSTGVTSSISYVSSEYDAIPFKMPRFEKRRSTNSVSIKDYDSLLAQARSEHSPRNSLSRMSLNLTPPITPSTSSFSLPSLAFSRESSPKRNLVRGLSRLRLHRRSASSTSAKADESQPCSHNDSKHHRSSCVLPRGQNYPTPASRKIIDSASNSANASGPTCCEQPIPNEFVRRIENGQEQSTGRTGLPMDRNSFRATAGRSQSHNDLEAVDEYSIIPRDSLRGSPKAPSDLELAKQRRNLHRALEYPRFKAMRRTQEEQRDRFVEMSRDMCRNINKKSEREKEVEQMLREHELQREELSDKHMQSVSRVEDKHVHDEMDLRSHHETEARNIAIALRHMEAFCKGESASGEPHHRIITEQDRRELVKTKTRAEALEKKHLAEISVLRGEQTGRMNQRVRRQEVEVQQLTHRHKRELDDVRERHKVALKKWMDEAERKRGLLEGWWRMQVDICKMELEREEGVAFQGSLPPVEWPALNVDGTERLQEMPVRAESVAEEARSRSPQASPLSRRKGISTSIALRGSIIG